MHSPVRRSPRLANLRAAAETTVTQRNKVVQAARKELLPDTHATTRDDPTTTVADTDGEDWIRYGVWLFVIDVVAIVLLTAMRGTSARPDLEYRCECPTATPVLSFFSACPQLSSWQHPLVDFQLSLASASIPFLQYTPIFYIASRITIGGALDQRRTVLLYVPLLVWGIMLVIDLFIKPYVGQPRPMNIFAQPCTAGAKQNGMPSGHSAISIAVALFITATAPAARKNVYGLGCAAWVMLVITSRLVFMYHTVAQVVLGSAVGLATFAVLSALAASTHSPLWAAPGGAEVPAHAYRKERAVLCAVATCVVVCWTPPFWWPAPGTARLRATAATLCTLLPFALIAYVDSQPLLRQQK